MARLSRKSRRNQRQNKSQRRNQQNKRSRRNQRQNRRQNRRSRRNQNRRNRRSRRNIRGGMAEGEGEGANEDLLKPTRDELLGKIATLDNGDSRKQTLKQLIEEAANEPALTAVGEQVEEAIGAPVEVQNANAGIPNGVTENQRLERRRELLSLMPVISEENNTEKKQRITDLTSRIEKAKTNEDFNTISAEIQKSFPVNASKVPPGKNVVSPQPNLPNVEEVKNGDEDENLSAAPPSAPSAPGELSFKHMTQPTQQHGEVKKLEVYYTKGGNEICISKSQDMADKKCYTKN